MEVRPKETFIELNGLRGIAALLVVFAHFSSDSKYFDKNNVVSHNLWIGAVGVMIFFVLSGFLMMHVTNNEAPNKKNIHNFYVNRISRVLPLFVFMVFITYIYQLIFGSILGIDQKHLWFDQFQSFWVMLKHLFFINGYSIYWTIGVEIFFYLLFPFFWFLYYRLGLISLILSFLMLYYFSWQTDFTFTRSFNITRLNSCLQYFLLGCIAYHLIERLPLPSRSIHNRHKIIATCIMIVSIAFLNPHVIYTLAPQLTEDWSYRAYWTKHYWLLLLYFVIFAGIIKLGIFSGALSSRILALLGAISYSIYLTHRLIVYHSVALMKKLNVIDVSVQLTALFLVIIPVIVGISYLTWQYIELPCQNKLRHRLIAK